MSAPNLMTAVSSLRFVNVSKHYGAVHALDDVSFTVKPGLTGIVGDNGAGKSTFMKILSGVIAPTAGSIELDDLPIQISTPTKARALGIESLYQDLALADTLNIPANVFLGREITDRKFGVRYLAHKKMMAATRQALSEVNIRIPDVLQPVRSLSGGQRQAVALARAIYFQAPVVLLDEPTAALGPRETAAVNEMIDRLVELGRMVVVVTHDIPYITAAADRLIVFRAGKVVRELNASETSHEKLLAFMVGTSS
jgi:ABC-type sugar transport system ATPase subunit